MVRRLVLVEGDVKEGAGAPFGALDVSGFGSSITGVGVA